MKVKAFTKVAGFNTVWEWSIAMYLSILYTIWQS